MKLTLKSQPQDFVVDEILGFEPSWKWAVLYILIEKINTNTMEILDLLYKAGLTRSQIGIAWLKDKVWITSQWISIYKRNIDNIWWMDKLFFLLRKKCKILKYSWHDKLLTIWGHQWNSFKIVLRGENITENEKKLLNEKIEISKNWVPNLFGEQRFWKEWKNAKYGLEILNRNIWPKTWSIDKLASRKNDQKNFQNQFRVQAYISYIFNEYAKYKAKKWLTNGDILLKDWKYYVVESENNENISSEKNENFSEKTNQIKIFEVDYKNLLEKHKNQPFFWPKLEWNETKFSNPERFLTWPLIGYNLFLPPASTWAFNIEKSFLKNFGISMVDMNRFLNFWLYGVRRNIFLIPKNLEYKWENNDLHINFELEKWWYATTIIDFITKNLNK